MLLPLPRCARHLLPGACVVLGLAAGGGSPAAFANESSQATVLAAIREVWPQEHHDSAIRLAKLESGLSPTARGCAGACLGLFQIHYPANRRMLAAMGIDRPEHLLDPIVNSAVAYEMFRQSGWRPWGGKP
jgi:hypothetical protein